MLVLKFDTHQVRKSAITIGVAEPGMATIRYRWRIQKRKKESPETLILGLTQDLRYLIKQFSMELSFRDYRFFSH